jgi:gliding motility-associated lipoprotein GldH
VKRIIPLLFVALLLSCGNGTVFKKYHRFDNITWDRFEVLNFELDAKEGQPLDFDFLFRHHTLYLYDFIDVNITFYTPSGATLSRDYHFMLKDEEGNWKASGAGDLWDIAFPIRKEMKFSKGGICKIRIENKMTKINTPGVVEVGLLAKTH